MILDENLVDVYILPLIRLTRNQFVGYFKYAKLTKKNNQVAVVLTGSVDIDTEHPQYITDFDSPNGDTVVLYSIPEEFSDDIELFKEGKFSKMSRKTKAIILKYSGLAKGRTIDGMQITDIRLLGLSDSKKMKTTISTALRWTVPMNGEILILKNKQSIYLDENY